MELTRPELIVHPVRLRIVEAVAGHSMTSQQIAERLPDVPQATLYRQIKILLEGGILQVAEERQVHGIVEKTYTMPEEAGHLTREEFAAISPADHSRYFAILLGVLTNR